MQLSDKIKGLEESPIRKFNTKALEVEQQGRIIHWLNIGQPDIETPSCFMEAVSGFRETVLAYEQSPGRRSLQQAICRYYHRYHVDLDPDDVLITTGGSEALSMVSTCILNEGDLVMTPEPFYTNYHTFVRAAGGDLLPIPTQPEDGYAYAKMELLEDTFQSNVKAILCSAPGNPTGTTLTHEEMKTICEFAGKHDLWIIADEVYREFCYDGKEPVSFGALSEYRDRLILIDSVSKRFSACGARIGALITKNQDMMHSALKLAQSRLCTATLDQIGAEALYHLPASYFDATREEYQKRRDVFYEEIMKTPGVICKKPGGAFYMTIQLPVDNAEDFLLFMLQEFNDQNETVMFTPAAGFYSNPEQGKNKIRIAYVLCCDELRRSAALLRQGLEAYQKKHRKGK